MSSFFLFFFLFFLPVQVRVNSSASSRSLFCSERILRGRFCIKVHSVQNTKKPAPFWKQVLETGFFASAGGGTWTLMVLLPHGPEPCASANSATSAFLLCRFVYISQRHVELYYKTVILSTTFSKKYFLKKFKKVLAKSFRLWYIITRRWELNNKSSERYAEVSELADEQD